MGFLAADDLRQILTKSRVNNAQREITGVLLYREGNVLQIVEGREQAVIELFDKIKADTRHGGVIKLYQKPIEQRDFSDWSMGFHDLGAKDVVPLEGYSRFMEQGCDLSAISPSQAEKLIKSFKRSVGRV